MVNTFAKRRFGRNRCRPRQSHLLGEAIIGVRERYANPIGLACFFLWFFSIGIDGFSPFNRYSLPSSLLTFHAAKVNRRLSAPQDQDKFGYEISTPCGVVFRYQSLAVQGGFPFSGSIKVIRDSEGMKLKKRLKVNELNK